MNDSIYLYISLMVAVISLLVTAILSIVQMKRTSHWAMQTNRLSIFAEYTRRYQEIILGMPSELFVGAKKCADSEKYLRLYFDLCSEECHLYGRNIVPEEIWRNWCDGMRCRMRTPVFLQGWEELKNEYDDCFVAFMEGQIVAATVRMDSSETRVCN